MLNLLTIVLIRVSGEFPLCQGAKNPTGVLEDVGLIHGLTQWVKDPALPQALAELEDVAWIWHCCGCGGGPAAVAPIQPLVLGTPYAMGTALKRKRKEKKKQEVGILRQIHRRGRGNAKSSENGDARSGHQKG